MILYSPVFVKKKRREPNFGEEVRETPLRFGKRRFFLAKARERLRRGQSRVGGRYGDQGRRCAGELGLASCRLTYQYGSITQCNSAQDVGFLDSGFIPYSGPLGQGEGKAASVKFTLISRTR